MIKNNKLRIEVTLNFFLQMIDISRLEQQVYLLYRQKAQKIVERRRQDVKDQNNEFSPFAGLYQILNFIYYCITMERNHTITYISHTKCQCYSGNK